MIQSIVFTDVRESNQPWFALVMKRDTPSSVVVLVKFENYLFQLDCNALVRKSLWIRNLERFYSKNDAAANEGFIQTLGELTTAPSNHSAFKQGKNRIIYPAELASKMGYFPLEDASFFAQVALNKAMEQVNGTSQEISERERVLERQIKDLQYQLKAKARKKRLKAEKPTY